MKSLSLKHESSGEKSPDPNNETEYAKLTNCTENSNANNEKPKAFLNCETVQGSECLRAWRYSSGAPALRTLQGSASHVLSDSESPEASRCYRPTQKDSAEERRRLSKEKGGMQA
jgi:hypothetical protein